MKTNQIMVRPMGDFKVTQRTKDGFFNATELLKQWNHRSGMQKDISHYFNNKATDEFVSSLISEEKLASRNSVYVKSKASRGENVGTWMHPLLFIDFAMWLNPAFKVKVLKFVYDEMIKFRNLAGDAYPSMCRAVRSILSEDVFREKIKDLARSLNIIVTASTKVRSGIRLPMKGNSGSYMTWKPISPDGSSSDSSKTIKD
ncbi:KilA-N domain-containing protein [Bacteroides fragilis]